MRRALVIAILVCGCSRLEFGVPPRFQSPILNSNWEPQAPNALHHPGSVQRTAAKRPRANSESLRARMIREAQQLATASGSRGGYGLVDTQSVLLKASGKTADRFRTIYELVRNARRLDAFQVNGDPTPGDLVIFHNTADLNGNGQNDDWHSSCGIVIGDRGRGYQAVVRTGNQPRVVHFWPDGPGLRMLGDRPINSFLRVPARSDPKGTDYLAGSLYAGHIDIDKLVASLH